MHDFFELAASTDLSTDKVSKTLASWRKSDIIDWLSDAQLVASAENSTPPQSFGFVANTTLSAGAYPCSDLACRLANAGELSQFAALYADRVVIRNPFDRYHTGIPVNVLREQVANDLKVLFALEPLVSAGLVAIAAPGVSCQ